MSTTTAIGKGQRLRATLDHPVIDADGHTIEVTPVLLDFVRDVGGAGAVEVRGVGARSAAQPP